jgi:hypothetical protein
MTSCKESEKSRLVEKTHLKFEVLLAVELPTAESAGRTNEIFRLETLAEL